MNKPCSRLKSDRRRLLCHKNLLQPHRPLNGRHQNPGQIRITPNHPVFVMSRLLVPDLPKQFMMIPFLPSQYCNFTRFSITGTSESHRHNKFHNNYSSYLGLQLHVGNVNTSQWLYEMCGKEQN